MKRIQRLRLDRILALSAEVDDKFGCTGGTLKQSQFLKIVPGHAMLIFFLNLELNVSLFESAICLVPAKLWNFLEARMLYDKCFKKSIVVSTFYVLKAQIVFLSFQMLLVCDSLELHLLDDAILQRVCQQVRRLEPEISFTNCVIFLQKSLLMKVSWCGSG